MPRRKKTLVVTGATGFVGRHFVQRILREDTFHVRCLVRPHSDLSALEALGVDISFHHGDFTREASLQPAFDGAWAVVNLAGYR